MIIIIIFLQSRRCLKRSVNFQRKTSLDFHTLISRIVIINCSILIFNMNIRLLIWTKFILSIQSLISRLKTRSEHLFHLLLRRVSWFSIYINFTTHFFEMLAKEWIISLACCRFLIVRLFLFWLLCVID